MAWIELVVAGVLAAVWAAVWGVALGRSEGSSRVVEHAESLDVHGQHGDGPIDLREVLVHMIEEYARDCGHADLLRECTDGRVGQ